MSAIWENRPMPPKITLAAPNTESDMEYIVSYQYKGWPVSCGNKSGTLDEVKQFARENQTNWKSFSFFQIIPNGSPVSDLKPITVEL